MSIRLSRKKINDMVDRDYSFSSRRSGGGSGAGGGGGVSSQWVDDHYVSKEFFARLFTINGTDENDDDVVVEPNDLETAIKNIQMMVGAWTEQYLSALGLSDGGSGGGGDPIALQDLVNVEYVGTPSGGQILKYNGTTGKWYNADESGGTVQDVTLAMPAGFGVQATTNQGTIALTVSLDRGEGVSALGNKLFLATPVTGDGAPSWRAITADDVDFSNYTFWGQHISNGVVTGSITVGNGYILLNNDKGIFSYNAPAEGETAATIELMRLRSNNTARLFYGTAAAGYSTLIYGDAIALRYGADGTNGLIITSSGLVTIGTGSTSSFVTEKLNVNGNIRTASGNGAYIQIGAVRLIYDSTNNAIKVEKSDGTAAGLYATGFLSALGANSSGGGGGPIALQDLVNVEYVGTPSGGQILKYNDTTGKWYNADDSGGTVQDVTLAMPAGFDVHKTTNQGTIALTVALDRGEGVSALGNKLFLATPVTGDGAPEWRALVADDIPTLTADKISDITLTNGTLTIGNNSITPITDATLKSDYSWWGQSLNNDGAVTGDITVGNGSIYLNNGKNIICKDSGGTDRSVIGINTSNLLRIGYGHSAGGTDHETVIYGSKVKLYYYDTSRSFGVVLDNNGNVGIGATSPLYKLHVNGYTKTSRLYLTDSVYLEYDSSNSGVHLVGAGLYADTYLSALGANSQQGGGGATSLGGLSDVTLSGTTPGQILQYDGSQWINVNMPASGVTSIKITVPDGFAVNPATAITTSGTFAISFGGSVAKNKVLAAPSAAAGVPSWRVLAVADMPDLSGVYLPLSGGTLTGNLYFGTTGLGVWLKDSASHQYAGIYDNGTNLWIGSTESSGTHHTGSTYISAGSGDVYINRLVSGVRREYKVLDANNGVTIDTAQTITGQKTFGKTILFSSGNFALAINATDTWTDGNSNKHYWYGYDHRYHNTGVYSTTISDYFGVTLRTGSGNLSMNQSGNIGIGTYAPSYKLDVSGTINCTSIRIGGYTITADTTNVGLRINGAGLYADTYISALGASTGGGGGGGVTLNEPLSSINSAGIGSPSGTDMAIVWTGSRWGYKNVPNSGGGGVTLNEPLASINTASLGSPSGTDMAIAWNGSQWIYKQIPSSGGGGSGVTSVGMTVPTGFSVNPGSIASSGTFAITFASGYSLPTTAKQGQWDEAYNAKHSHSNKSTLDGISSTKVDQWDAAYTWTNANGGSTVSKTAWGRTYWSAGAPQNVSGDLTSVGNITMTDDSSGARKIQFDANDNFHIRKISDRFIIKSNGSEVINIYNNQFYSAVNIVSAAGVTALSDIRYKDVVAKVSPRVEDIAGASIIRYTWKDRTDKTIHIGGIAQEWQKILPETVLESESRLTMDYGVIGAVAGIANARRLVDHEARIKRMEKEIELLKAMKA